jgi:peptide/nickel transport system ATP-binding protein
MAVMYAGKIVEMGTVDHIFNRPVHPYTRSLIACFPNIESEDRKIPEGIPGYPPNLIDPPEGCRFCPRCSLAESICSSEEPEFMEIEPGHFAACHFAGKEGGTDV